MIDHCPHLSALGDHHTPWDPIQSEKQTLDQAPALVGTFVLVDSMTEQSCGSVDEFIKLIVKRKHQKHDPALATVFHRSQVTSLIMLDNMKNIRSIVLYWTDV